MKRAIKVVCILALLCLCIHLSAGCSAPYGNRDAGSDGLRFCKHKFLPLCYASDFTWPSDETCAVIDIPDSVEGCRVISLGGFAWPNAFVINLPDADMSYERDTLPANVEIEQYHLVLNIGKYVREEPVVMLDMFHRAGENQVVQILVTVNCSPENPHFYSEDGRLYRRADNSLVEGFFYESDFGT